MHEKVRQKEWKQHLAALSFYIARVRARARECFSFVYTIVWMCNGTSECTHSEWNINEHISLAVRARSVVFPLHLYIVMYMNDATPVCFVEREAWNIALPLFYLLYVPQRSTMLRQTAPRSFVLCLWFVYSARITRRASIIEYLMRGNEFFCFKSI